LPCTGTGDGGWASLGWEKTDHFRPLCLLFSEIGLYPYPMVQREEG
jgi:hypothetical protein